MFYQTKHYMNVFQLMAFHKTSRDPEPLHIRFAKIDGFIKVRGGEFRHLLLFDYGLFDNICDKI